MNRLEIFAKFQLEAKGWKVYRNGWPDLMAVRTVDGKLEVMVIEVKRAYASLTEEQCQILTAFKKLGVPVKVYRESHTAHGGWDIKDFEVACGN